MAEAIFRNFLSKDADMKNMFETESAGVSALHGMPASSGSIRALKKNYGIDLERHRSRSINEKLVKDAYLVLTMTRSHKDKILRAFPQAGDKVFTLKEFIAGSEPLQDHDISDPYGYPLAVYEQCAEEIWKAMGKLVLKLKNEN